MENANRKLNRFEIIVGRSVVRAMMRYDEPPVVRFKIWLKARILVNLWRLTRVFK